MSELQRGAGALPSVAGFDVLAPLGAGGGGAVYRARDLDSGEVVALKLLHGPTPTEVRRLQVDFPLLKNLQHPNLVQLKRFGQASDQWFLTMELVQGVDFVHYARPQNDELDPTRLRAALQQCVLGLSALHDQGKLHCDVKPHNVLVTEDGRVVIVDFGLVTDARDDALQDTAGPAAGTVAYMAPEQVVGDVLSRASDWYALGVMMFEALTGQLPFSGAQSDVKLDKLGEQAPDPRTLYPGAPPDLSDLCLRLLSRGAVHRPVAAQILAALSPTANANAYPLGWIRPAPLQGRHAELGRLLRAINAPKQATQCIHITGDPGVGKTALMQELSARLDGHRGATLFWGGSIGSNRRMSHEGLQRILSELTEALLELPEETLLDCLPPDAPLVAQMFPSLNRVPQLAQGSRPAPKDPMEHRWRALAALRQILRELSRRRTTLVWIDHWERADLDTRRAVEQLFGGREGPPLVLVLVSDAAPEQLPSCEVDTMPLPPLPETQSWQLARTLLGSAGGAVDDAAVGALVRASGGNPMLLEQSTRAFVANPARRPIRSEGSSVLGERLADLDDPERSLIEVMALAGTPLSSAMLSLAAALDTDETRRALAAAWNMGLVREDRSSGETLFEPAHASIATTVVEQLDMDRATVHHAGIADALAGGGPALAEISLYHCEQAGRFEAATGSARLAAAGATRELAFDRAADLHDKAAYHTERKDELCAYKSAQELAEIMALAGRSIEAAYAYQLAFESANAAEDLELKRRAAELCLRSGYWEAMGLELVGDAAEAVHARLPETPAAAGRSLMWQRAWLRLRGLHFRERSAQQISPRDLTRIDVFWSIGSLVGMIDHVRGAELQARGLRLALETGEPFRVARALTLEATLRSHQAPLLLDRAREINQRLQDDYLVAMIDLGGARAAAAQGDYSSASELSRRAERQFRDRCTDAVWEVAATRQVRITALLWTGQTRDLQRSAHDFLQQALERGDKHNHAALTIEGAYGARLCADDPQAARGDLDGAIEVFPGDTFLTQHLSLLTADAIVANYSGEPIDEERIEDAQKRAGRAGLLRVPAARARLMLVRLWAMASNARRGEHNRAREARRLRQLSRSLQRLSLHHTAGLAHLARAQAAHLVGNPKLAHQELQSAYTSLAGARSVTLAQCTAYRLGELLGGDEGHALKERARRELSGVANLERFVRAFVPSFRD